MQREAFLQLIMLLLTCLLSQLVVVVLLLAAARLGIGVQQKTCHTGPIHPIFWVTTFENFCSLDAETVPVCKMLSAPIFLRQCLCEPLLQLFDNWTAKWKWSCTLYKPKVPQLNSMTRCI